MLQSSNHSMTMSLLMHCCYCFCYCYTVVVVFFFLNVEAAHEHGRKEQDVHLLLSFKASADPGNATLQSWEGTDPCSGSWFGVTCYRGRVVGLRVDGASLTGSITPLFGLPRLRALSLRSNALSGPLPHLSYVNNQRLRHLFLSRNRLSGILNVSLLSLASLRIESNEFSGGLEGLRLPAVRDFNVSGNSLSGEITNLLSKFPASAFAGNRGLCGVPLSSCAEISRLSEDNATVSPSPLSAPANNYSSRSSISFAKAGLAAVIVIGISDLLAIALGVAIIIGMYFWLRRKLLMSLNGTAGIREPEPDQQQEEKAKDTGLVCFEGGEDLRLDCLLKASAEVLGKGLSGSTYKAVLEDGIIVAVKRLSAMQFPSHSKAFDRQMHLIGRVRHPHLVSLRAYCNAHEEKLLVYDFMPNGCLLSLLQNNRGRTLDWMSRKQLLMGAAEGLAFIHAFPARSPLVHANIKPSNILIDDQGNACIAEWGIMRFASNFHQSLPSSYLLERTVFAQGTTRQGYRAPELLNGKEQPSQESDVYSFGMVLLEVVTDKEIDDAECEGEMMGMVKIGMLCTSEIPEERPKMSQVVRMMSDFV